LATWAYVALEATGKKKSGFVDANDKEAAIANISTTGRYVLEITEARGTQGQTNVDPRKKGKISRAELAMFTRRLSDLSSAGLPLDRVLQVIAEQSESGTLAEISELALEDVRAGLPVSAALAKYPKYFPPVFTETIRAGEASGQLPQVASRLADFQALEVARRSQVVSALIYPSVLLFTAVGVIVFLLTFVVPKLSDVFKGLGNDLPATTKMLFAMTDFLTGYGLYIIGAIIIAIFAYRAWVGTDAGALGRDRLLVKTPIVGKIIYKSAVSRFARVLATLVYGGVPILGALELAGLASGNRVFQLKSKVVEEDVREGRPIADAMRDAGDFPPVLTHMVAIGEETGDLPKMLGRVSDSLDFEVENGMRRLTALVEPVIVLGMGVFVGFVVLSVLLPIFQAQTLVK
jgi:type II secretory pathway component PulF